jgi:hypothetical protein
MANYLNMTAKPNVPAVTQSQSGQSPSVPAPSKITGTEPPPPGATPTAAKGSIPVTNNVPSAASSANNPNIDATQQIYNQIDQNPATFQDVATLRLQANQQTEDAAKYTKMAEDPAMIASGKASEYLSMASNLRAQAQQSLEQWKQLRTQYAAPAIAALTKQTEALAGATPDVVSAEAKKAQAIAQAQQNVSTRQSLAKSQLEEQNNAAKSAYAQLFRLNEMDRQFSSLPQSGFTAPGSFATERLNFAKNINSALAGLGAKPLFSPDDVASAETLGKDTKRLGFETSKAMGGREPGFIVQQAISANPGIDNTPMGYRRIVAGLKQAAQYEQDRSDFYNDYYSKKGDLVGAETAFREANPVENYGKAAVISTIPPAAVDYLRKNPDQAKAFDAKYGIGSSKMVIGQ